MKYIELNRAIFVPVCCLDAAIGWKFNGGGVFFEVDINPLG
jgi:hypothetical protein